MVWSAETLVKMQCYFLNMLEETIFSMLKVNLQ